MNVSNERLFVETTDSPLGRIFIAASEKGLAFVEFGDRSQDFEAEVSRRFGPIPRAKGGHALEARKALDRYFAGELTALDSLACDAEGTPFQRKVWDELRRIPSGRTLSYAGLARAIGNPKAVRAVGGANSRNPIPIVVPCHRVIGASGDLVGFASGLDRKKWLLAHEGALIGAT